MRNKQLKIFILIATISFTFIYLQTRFNLFPETKLVKNKEIETKKELSIPTKSPTTVKFKNKDLTINAQLAINDEEKNKGLMFVEKLQESEGMLFVYNQDTTGKFWMKNCKINLDIIFFNKYGEIIYIAKNVPPCKKEPCELYGPIVPYRYVLEIKGRLTQEKDITKGDLINIEK